MIPTLLGQAPTEVLTVNKFWTGDGVTCDDINECDNGSHRCTFAHNGVGTPLWDNNNNVFTCTCPSDLL